MSKYPRDMVELARSHYNFTPHSAKMRTSLIAICIRGSDISVTGRKKPEALKQYTALEIAEMIKDIDRNV